MLKVFVYKDGSAFEHMQKTILKYVSGLTENEKLSSWKVKQHKRYGNVVNVRRNITSTANCGGVPCTPTEKEDSTIVEEDSGTVIGPGSGQESLPPSPR